MMPFPFFLLAGREGRNEENNERNRERERERERERGPDSRQPLFVRYLLEGRWDDRGGGEPSWAQNATREAKRDRKGGGR